jgi:hypothetical protein
MAIVTKKSDIARFKTHVRAEGECWVWTGRINKGGYGEFKHGGEKHKAHRWIWETLNGVLPSEIVIDHLCRNRSCVRPDHLEAVTNEENVRRGILKRR